MSHCTPCGNIDAPASQESLGQRCRRHLRRRWCYWLGALLAFTGWFVVNYDSVMHFVRVVVLPALQAIGF